MGELLNEVKCYSTQLNELVRKSLFSANENAENSAAIKSLDHFETNDAALKEMHKMQGKTDESLDKTIEMLTTTTALGNNTLVELNEQGKKLEEIDKSVDDLHTKLTTTEKMLRKFERWGFLPKFGKKKKMITTST